MKKTLLLIIFSISFTKISACDCDPPQLALEFQESKHVFLGKVVEKKYSLDNNSFKIIFNVFEHFKKGINPSLLEFNFENKKELTSCDWEINLNEKWIVFVKELNGKLTFSGICSNSSRILENKYPTFVKKISKNWRNFNIDKFIFSSLDGEFETSFPDLNLDSLITKYSKKNYGEEYGESIANIIVDINRNGEIIQTVINHHNKKIKPLEYDSIFHLYLYYPLKEFEPVTEFQKDMINEVRKIKKWNPVLIRNTNISVPYRKHLQFQKIKDSIYRHYKY
ncbi:conserved protein of unknown function [Tenacibaculum soleae]|uniref:hypothetical protein n=1 Tax=Tenacibaculum soleae TaxID=447689 RepID=UPI003AB730B9